MAYPKNRALTLTTHFSMNTFYNTAWGIRTLNVQALKWGMMQWFEKNYRKNARS